MYIIYDKETGIVDRALHADIEQVELNLSASEAYLEVEAPVIACLPDHSYVSEGLWVRAPKAPSPHHKWDWETKTHVPDLAAARAEKQQEANNLRNQKISEPIIYDGKVLDADKVSRERISGMIARLQRGDGLPPMWAGWRDADNQMHWVNDSPETVLERLKELSRAIEDREQALLVTAWSHKAAIEELKTLEQILNYSVEF